jgi:hypothetical protein
MRFFVMLRQSGLAKHSSPLRELLVRRYTCVHDKPYHLTESLLFIRLANHNDLFAAGALESRLKSIDFGMLKSIFSIATLDFGIPNSIEIRLTTAAGEPPNWDFL